MHTALDIGTHFVASQKVSHLTSFSSYSSYNSFIFEVVTVEIYMTFTIILGSCSRLSTMYVQMYKGGENVTCSTEHLCALHGEPLAYCAHQSRREQCISQWLVVS